MLQQGNINYTIAFSDPQSARKTRGSTRGVTTPPNPGNSRHPRVVPTVNRPLFNQFQQFPFTHKRMSEIEPSKFNLLGTTFK